VARLQRAFASKQKGPMISLWFDSVRSYCLSLFDGVVDAASLPLLIACFDDLLYVREFGVVTACCESKRRFSNDSTIFSLMDLPPLVFL
jgi:hypothetical protein